MFIGWVSIAFDCCNKTGAEHCSGRAGQERLADDNPIADSAGSNYTVLLGLFQDVRQRLVQSSRSLHMPTGFRALADEIIGTEIERCSRAFLARHLHPPAWRRRHEWLKLLP